MTQLTAPTSTYSLPGSLVTLASPRLVGTWPTSARPRSHCQYHSAADVAISAWTCCLPAQLSRVRGANTSVTLAWLIVPMWACRGTHYSPPANSTTVGSMPDKIIPASEGRSGIARQLLGLKEASWNNCSFHGSRNIMRRNLPNQRRPFSNCLGYLKTVRTHSERVFIS